MYELFDPLAISAVFSTPSFSQGSMLADVVPLAVSSLVVAGGVWGRSRFRVSSGVRIRSGLIVTVLAVLGTPSLSQTRVLTDVIPLTVGGFVNTLVRRRGGRRRSRSRWYRGWFRSCWLWSRDILLHLYSVVSCRVGHASVV